MAFDLEGQAMALTKIHNTGVFPRTYQDSRAFGGELAQQGPGVAVTAMLRPHHPKHAQLGPIGMAPQTPHDFVVVLWCQALLLDLRSNGWRRLIKGWGTGSRGGSQGAEPSRQLPV